MRVHALLLTLLCLAPQASSQGQVPRSDEEFFGLDKLWDIHFTMSPASWRKLFPEGGMNFGFAQQRPKFPYVKVGIEIAGHPKMQVGLRFKGHSQFSSSRGTLKRPFKVDFDRYAQQQTFLGLRKLNLQNNGTDATQIKEAVCYVAYAQAGIPACRTAFARVYITLTGKTKRAYVGLYTLVEQVDRNFLEHHLETKGTILKPEMQVLGYFGEKWTKDYEQTYLPKTEVKPQHARTMIKLAALAEDQREAQRNRVVLSAKESEAFAKALEQVMDVDSFLRYAAVTALLRNWDNPLNIAHNVYLVIPDSRNKVMWVPWDLNLALSGFGGLNMFGSGSILEPARIAFGRGVLRVERYKKAYRKHLEELLGGCCSAKALTKSIRLARKTTAKAIAAEADRIAAVTDAADDPDSRPLFGAGLMRRQTEDLESVVQRIEREAKDELAGKGPPPRRGGFGRGFGGRRTGPEDTLRNVIVASGVLGKDQPVDLKGLLVAAEACFGKLDKDRSQSLANTELRAGVRAHLKGRQDRNIFSRGHRTLSRALHRALDKDRNRQVSTAEWQAGCKTWFPRWDTDKDGKLSGSELSGR